MFSFLERQPRHLAAIESFLLLGVVGWVDAKTGYETTLALFYGLPILFAVRLCDRKTPFAIAALSCVIWGWIDLTSGHQYLSATVHAWEITIRSAFFFLVAIAGVAVKDRQSAADARVALLEYAQKLEHQINEIAEYEQLRIGRELHDGLCQYLAAVSCATTSLKIDIARRGLTELVAKTAQIEGLLSDSVNQARDLARSLAPVQKDEAGLAAALHELTAATARRFGIECTFECAGENEITPNGKTTHLYRIAQEAIDNAAHHGKAHAIAVRLSANPSAVSLSVADDGVGFSKTNKNLNGAGIEVMRYRAKALGGEIEIEERPKGGTIVSCIAPAEGLN